MAKNFLSIDFTAFEDLAEQFEKAGGNLHDLIEEAMQDLAEDVTDDTRAAMAPGFLPAGGKYSTGTTEAAIVPPQVKWVGSVAEAPVGFDKSKPGYGGYLITGTPRMRPDRELNRIYRGKKYQKNRMDEIRQTFMDNIDILLGR